MVHKDIISIYLGGVRGLPFENFSVGLFQPFQCTSFYCRDIRGFISPMSSSLPENKQNSQFKLRTQRLTKLKH